MLLSLFLILIFIPLGPAFPAMAPAPGPVSIERQASLIQKEVSHSIEADPSGPDRFSPDYDPGYIGFDRKFKRWGLPGSVFDLDYG